MNDYVPADELLIPAVWAAAHPIVTAAREVYGRPLPRLRSMEYLSAPRVVQQAVLVIGGESLVLGDPVRVLMRQISNDIWPAYMQLDERQRRGGTETAQPGVGTERRGLPGECVPHEVIARRRAQPGPMAGGTAA